MFYILSKINFCMKGISWVYLSIPKNQKKNKTKHHNSEQSRTFLHPLPWHMQGHLKQPFHPASGYERGKQKWEGRLKAIENSGRE